MFEKIRSSIDALEQAIAALEPGCVPGDDAATLVELFARGERICAAGKTLAAKRVDDSNVWRRSAQKSAAHWLAARTGETLGAAIGTLEMARQLDGLAATRTAFASGQLSVSQARSVAEAASAAPHAERDLLARAQSDSVVGLAQECRRVAAAAGDQHEREERIRRTRYLRTWTDHEGAGCGQWRLSADQHALVLSAVEARQSEIFDEARRQDRREASEAYAADALVDLCTGRAEPDVSIDVIVDLADLTDDREPGRSASEIPGVGPISAAAARRLLGQSALTLFIRDGIDIRSVVHAGHQPTTAQRRTVFLRDRHQCVVAGCPSRRRLEIHHVDGWSLTRKTAIDRLCLVCPYHHDLVTHRGYTIAGSPGRWLLVAPRGDPGRGPPGAGPGPTEVTPAQQRLLDALAVANAPRRRTQG